MDNGVLLPGLWEDVGEGEWVWCGLVTSFPTPKYDPFLSEAGCCSVCGCPAATPPPPPTVVVFAGGAINDVALAEDASSWGGFSIV